MRTALAAALLLALAACRTAPDEQLRIAFDDSGKDVTLTATTEFPDPGHATDPDAVLRLKNEVLAGRDAWSLRFAHAEPQRDSVTFERDRENLLSVEHSATIPAADLQKFFYDLPVSTTVLRGDGWVELTIVPGASERATREQREAYDRELHGVARKAIDYFAAVRVLYEYLDRNPERAHDVFTEFVHDPNDGAPPVATNFELQLLQSISARAGELLSADWNDFGVEAELATNPFPGTVTVSVPTKPLIVEGFTRRKNDLVIERRSAMEALLALEGRWVSPDPLATLLRLNEKKGETIDKETFIASLADAPRRADPVIGVDEVVSAFEEQMRLAPRYRVRFKGM